MADENCSCIDQMEPVRASAPLRAGAIEWAGLAILALPTMLLGLDVTLLYLALPALAGDLKPTSAQALWIMDIYGFMIAGFLVTMGTLGDRIGRRRLLMTGAAAFAAASVLAAFSTSAGMLIAARAVLGLAGAALMPSTLALISNMFPDARQRGLAIGIWATMFALGMAVGPLVGGALLRHFWWGSAFLVAVPVVGLMLVAAPALLPEYRAPVRGRLDLASVMLSLATLLPAIHFVKTAAEHGLRIGALLAVAIATVSGLAFVRRQRVLTHPLLDLRLLADRKFRTALCVLLVGLVGVGGTMLLVTQYLQLVLGLSPVTAGWWMGLPALAMLVAGIAAPLIARRVRPGLVMAAALTLSAVGYALLAALQMAPGVAVLVSGNALIYLGLGTIAALGTDLVVGSAPPEQAGSAAALSETVQELGISLGVATLGSLAAVVYRRCMAQTLPSDLPEPLARAAGDSLWAASAVGQQLPADVLAQARTAFVTGLTASAVAAAIAIGALALLSAVALGRDGGGAAE